MFRDEGTTEDWRQTESARRGVLREINEQIASLTRRFSGKTHKPSGRFVCECGDIGCTDPVTITLDTYELVRAVPRRYLILANHEDPETETVIARGEHYAVVETLAGKASMLAESTDPRRTARLAKLNVDRTATKAKGAAA